MTTQPAPNITPFTYEGASIRVLTINEAPWWVAADVAGPLALANIRSSLALLDDDEKGVHTMDTLKGSQSMAIISEAGLYSLILRSRKPEAKQFKRWVTHEVLPAIRRTGTYAARPQPQLSGKELLAAAVLEAAETIKQHEATIAQQAEDLAKALPKANTWDALCSGRGDHSITDAAKLLSSTGIATGPRKLHKQLQDLGWIHKNQRDKWAANQDKLNTGLLAEKVRHYIDDDGVSVLATPQVRVAPKGLEKLRELLTPAGLQEVLA